MSTTILNPIEPAREASRDSDAPGGGRAGAAALRLLLSRAVLWRDPPPPRAEIEAAVLRAANPI